jgi:hypothetical protein
MSAAERQRRWRHRERAGKVIRRAEVDELPFAEALIASGLLSESEALYRRMQEAAITAILREWWRRFTEKNV